jgi:dTDP-L-rhamnose 4-epimerase
MRESIACRSNCNRVPEATVRGGMGNVLVTGGAGFIGSHLVDALLARGRRVRVLDNLLEQAHPTGRARFLSAEADLVIGDLRDRAAVDRALAGVSVVFHLGAIVGNGQSLVAIRDYADINAVGTATLLEALAARRGEIRRLVIASSMVVYGDGAYSCREHGVLSNALRPAPRLRQRLWEPLCPHCSAEVEPVAIHEQLPLAPISPYGICKRDQEELCLCVGRAYGIPTIALRLLCTYGSRQALGNPYTGVAAIWASRLLNGRHPLVFEDGEQRRDFLHVSDAARAFIAAAEAPATCDYSAFNVGSGCWHTVLELAVTLQHALGSTLAPELSGEYREGDIRHCIADVARANRELGWSAQVSLRDGLDELAQWAAAETPPDRSEAALAELRQQGIVRQGVVQA